MAITLQKDVVLLTLPEHLLWVNEFEWRPVTQTAEYSVTGALIIEQAAYQAGRPIVLAGGASHGWISRADLKTLLQWSMLPGQQFTLTINDGRTFNVSFDHSQNAIAASPVFDFSDPDDTDNYIVTLRFLEI